MAGSINSEDPNSPSANPTGRVYMERSLVRRRTFRRNILTETMGNLPQNIPALSANSLTVTNKATNSLTVANKDNSLTVTNKATNSMKVANKAANRLRIWTSTALAVCILCCSPIASTASAQVPPEYRITESVVSAKAPKKLRTYIPFWGVPLRTDGTKESYEILDDCVVCFDAARHNGQADAADRTQDSVNDSESNNNSVETDAVGHTQAADNSSYGNGSTSDNGKSNDSKSTSDSWELNDSSRRLKWLSWNLDLASTAEDRYKFQRFVKDAPAREVLMQVIDECYRWAWRKPYGNTNLTMGPLYTTKRFSFADSSAAVSRTSDCTAALTTPTGRLCSQDTAEKVQYGWFVAVCKQEKVKGPAPLGYTSVAFVIPAKSSPEKNIYDLSRSVNGVEYISGYNLFPKLPLSVQEQVEEITVYELFCPFQEIDEDILLELVPEFDGGEFSEPFDKE